MAAYHRSDTATFDAIERRGSLSGSTPPSQGSIQQMALAAPAEAGQVGRVGDPQFARGWYEERPPTSQAWQLIQGRSPDCDTADHGSFGIAGLSLTSSGSGSQRNSRSSAGESSKPPIDVGHVSRCLRPARYRRSAHRPMRLGSPR